MLVSILLGDEEGAYVNEEKIVRGPMLLVSLKRKERDSRQFVDPFELMLTGSRQ
jgi:hypothetical protein